MMITPPSSAPMAMSEEKMKEAEAALDGPERAELQRAEEIGKSRAKSA